MLTNLLQLAFGIAVVAYVYCCVLPAPGMILYGWYVQLYKLAALTSKCREKQPRDVWWFKIIIGCEKCFAGQVAFWLFTYSSWKAGYYSFELLLYHIFFVCLSILLTIAIRKIVD